MPPASANLRWVAKFWFLKGFVFEFEFLPSHLLLLQLWLNLIFKICKIWYGPVCAVISRYSFPGSCVGTIFDIYALFDDIHRAFYNSFVFFVWAYMIISKPVYRIIIKPVHRSRRPWPDFVHNVRPLQPVAGASEGKLIVKTKLDSGALQHLTNQFITNISKLTSNWGSCRCLMYPATTHPPALWGSTTVQRVIMYLRQTWINYHHEASISWKKLHSEIIMKHQERLTILTWL